MCRLCLGLALGALVFPSLLSAQGIRTVRIASGLDRPLYATSPPGDTSRMFILEQHTGNIKILNLTTFDINPTPFLTVGPLSLGNEQGLLGMAFHPDYAINGQFFINRTDASGDTQIERYQVSADPNIANSTPTSLLSISQPQGNHNGGWMGFGPDGFLYAASGDGGGSNDNDPGHTIMTGNAQDVTNNLLGKILRIDVDSTQLGNYGIPAGNPLVGITGDDEIWAYGLRNPWRASFDRQTGDLYIGDVGQNVREEIDVQPAASTGGENYGWRLREGTIATVTEGVGGDPPPGAIDPIYNYNHGIGPTQGNVVTGGYVYRGPIPELDGHYLFGDFDNDRIWSLRYDGSDPSLFDGTNFTDFTDRTMQFVPNVSSIGDLSSFAEDEFGNVYIIDLGAFDDFVTGGEIFKIVVDLPGDGNLDFAVDAADYTIWANGFDTVGAELIDGDYNEDTLVDAADYTTWANNFGMTVAAPAAVPEPSALVLLVIGAIAVLWRRASR